MENVAANELLTDWRMLLEKALSDAAELLHADQVIPAFQVLGPRLSSIWESAVQNQQLNDAEKISRAHAIFSLVQQDPYSHRAFHKPRGYAGDAVMLDYVYAGSPASETSDMGRVVFKGTTRGPMGLSVVFRRHLLSAHINQVVSTKPGFRILSVASGHCREIEDSLLGVSEVASSGEFVAFDQDSESCELVEKQYANYPVKVVCSSVRKLLSGPSDALGTYDLIYSAGLFDYLADPVASKLIDSLSSMLRPGGKLLVGNFAPSSFGRGYMELLLDWKLIYRGGGDLVNLFGPTRANSVTTFLDPHANVMYAEWKKSL